MCVREVLTGSVEAHISKSSRDRHDSASWKTFSADHDVNIPTVSHTPMMKHSCETSKLLMEFRLILNETTYRKYLGSKVLYINQCTYFSIVTSEP